MSWNQQYKDIALRSWDRFVAEVRWWHLPLAAVCVPHNRIVISNSKNCSS